MTRGSRAAWLRQPGNEPAHHVNRARQPTARGRHLEDKHIAVGGELYCRDRQWSLSLPKRDGPLDIEAERAKKGPLSIPPQ